MMYESPITILQRARSMGFADRLANAVDGAIYKAVLDVGVQVDKEELLKALQYDRNQYEKGYWDAKSEVIRCRDCVHDNMMTCPMCYIEQQTLQFINHDPEFYCGKGERKVSE